MSFYALALAVLLAALPFGRAVVAGVPSRSPDVPAAQDGQEQDQEVGPDNSVRKILPDFAEITPTLYRGAQASHEGFRKLADMGVKIVIDLRGNRKSERKFVNSLGMSYVPMGWECSFPKDKTFAEFLTLIVDNPGTKIFVHCRVGDDRTGMMIAAYRMAEQGWSAEKAKKEMERFGFGLVHRRLICPRLSSYEEHFPERFRTEPAFRDLRERQSEGKTDCFLFFLGSNGFPQQPIACATVFFEMVTCSKFDGYLHLLPSSLLSWLSIRVVHDRLLALGAFQTAFLKGDCH